MTSVLHSVSDDSSSDRCQLGASRWSQCTQHRLHIPADSDSFYSRGLNLNCSGEPLLRKFFSRIPSAQCFVIDLKFRMEQHNGTVVPPMSIVPKPTAAGGSITSRTSLHSLRHCPESLRPRQSHSRSRSRSPAPAPSGSAPTSPAVAATLAASAHSATHHCSRSRSASPDLAPPCAPRDPHRNPRAIDAAARLLGLPGGFDAMRGTNCLPHVFCPAEFALRPEDCLKAINARQDEAERQWELLRRARTSVCHFFISNRLCPECLPLALLSNSEYDVCRDC